PGTKVRFSGWAGDSYLLATPTSIAADGTSLTVNVPLFAQTGPLVVKIPDGTSLSSQTFTVRDYRNTYGFSFRNFNDFNITEGLIDDEYGSPVHSGDVIGGAIIGGIFGGPAGAVQGAEAAAAADAAAAAAYLAFCALVLNGKGACFGMVLTSIQMQNNP